jgi:enoyl-CoA hydratase/carnithine racemase
MAYAEVIYDVSDYIATITFNRPQQLNTFSDVMLREVTETLREARYDENVRTVVLTGAGRAFCAGADVKQMGATAAAAPAAWERRQYLKRNIHQIARLLFEYEKPVIASVNGAAIGAGCDISMMCDMRIAADTARFGETYVKVGIAPGNGGMWLLPRLVGLPKAMELILTGDIIDAQEALRIGLVNKVVPADQLAEATREFAGKVAGGAPIAVQIAKMGINKGLEMTFPAALELAALSLGTTQTTQDHVEGSRAFAEKRKPNFQGR